MGKLYTGYPWGATERVTNTKLDNMVNNASLASIVNSDFAPSWSILSTNASVPDVNLYTALTLYYSTYGSIASLTNARVGQAFTLIAGQASFPAIIDTGNFLLSANWIPAKTGDNLTLIWNGTNFIEISRVSV